MHAEDVAIDDFTISSGLTFRKGNINQNVGTKRIPPPIPTSPEIKPIKKPKIANKIVASKKFMKGYYPPTFLLRDNEGIFN